MSNKILKHHWHTTSPVKGYGRGKFLGFPTINMVIPDDFEYLHGIYAGLVELEGIEYLGAFHYGPVPTFDQDRASLEVFVLDENLETVPSYIKISLEKRLRDIVSFANQEDLISQIGRDVEEVREVFDDK